VEAFEALSAGPGEFAARSAPFERVRAQLSSAGPLSDKLVVFALGYLGAASRRPGAEELSRDYLRYLGGAP
jgi:hypothetical protein